MAKPKTDKQLEEEVLALAEYLGCNGPELWNEMKQIIYPYAEAVAEEAVEAAMWHERVGGQ